MAAKEKQPKSTLRDKMLEGASKTTVWCYEHLPNDPHAMEEVTTIGNDTIMKINKSFLISFNYDQWSVPAFIFSMYFESLMEHIMSKRATNPLGYSVNVCNCFQVGYENNVRTDNEKVGNISPFIYHRGVSNMVDLSQYIPAGDARKTTPPDDISKIDKNTFNRIVSEWNMKNPAVTLGLTSAEVVAIEQATFRRAKQANITIGTSQSFILPMVIAFYEAILARLVMRKQSPVNAEKSFLSINILGYFNAIIQEPEDPQDANYMGYYISFQPTNYMKLTFKDDVAAGKFEED
jgi:hypothetical protein